METALLPLLLTTSCLFAQEAVTTTTTTTTTVTEATAPVAVAQAEVVRRQELVFRANQSIAEGEKAENSGEYATALAKYQFALENLSESPSTAPALQKARAGVVRVSVIQYNEAKKAGDTAAALSALETAAKYDPNNVAIKERLARIRANQKKPGKGTVLGNPAVTPQFIEDVKQVDQLLVEAEQYRRTGQLDEAEASYKKALAIDRYNDKASKGIEAIVAEKQQYARTAQYANRAERLREIEEKWTPTPRREVLSRTTAVAATPFTLSNQFAINQKLRSFVIKDLVFNDATIEDAANSLAVKSRELDTDKAKLGISFIVRPEAAASAKPFSLNLRNIPMEDALRYITQLANVKYKVEEFAVVIVPLRESTEVLLRRSFNVSPSFFPPPSAVRAEEAGAGGTRRPPPVVPISTESGSTNDVKSLLEERGVDFKTPGSSAVYYPGSGVLHVTNTQEQLDLIEELVNAGATPTYMVDVACKLVEINQEDLNDFTINAGINVPGLSGFTSSGGTIGSPGFLVNPDNIPNGKVSATTNLRGSQGFSVGGLDSLLGTSGLAAPNQFLIQGNIGNSVFNFIISALSRKKSFDMLSSPSLRVKNGEDATINVSRTFFYPTTFDPAESAAVQTVSQSGGGGQTVGPPIVIPTFPTEFESRDIGVKMKVRPQLGADNKTIDLALFPEVTDFEGFINYGSPIFVVGGDLNNGINGSNSYLLSSNVLNQPVFNTRRIDTKVFVKDGNTVVLGGLMRNDIQTINDKVPILGDLPLIGRLFQSKATQSQKKNLLIFVTCRIYLNNGELLNPPTNVIPIAASGSAPTAAR